MKIISNEEYFSIIDKLKEDFQRLRQEAISITTGIIGESLCKVDMYFYASADRCVRLIDGMISMLEGRNLTCAGALLRMQMDNCMRTYAAYIAEDKNAVVDCIIEGKSVGKLKDTEGNQMTDAYLKKGLCKYDNRFKQVYNEASGFIHLSNKAFYQTVVACENGRMKFQIGMDLPEKRNDPLLECAEAFMYYCKLHFQLLKPVADSKKRFDEVQLEKEEEALEN